MDTFKRAVWIIGGVLVGVALVLVVVCLWALNKKQEGYDRIRAAAANRWKSKTEKSEESLNDNQVDSGTGSPSSNGVADNVDSERGAEGSNGRLGND